MFLWDVTKDGKTWAYGSSCRVKDKTVCNADPKVNNPQGYINTNYDPLSIGTGFSYSTNFWCP